jgi:Protein of unknown function (DUF3363)
MPVSLSARRHSIIGRRPRARGDPVFQSPDVRSQKPWTQCVTHGSQITEPVIGRALAKGLAGDEMGDRLHLVIDGVDGRTHCVETADASRLDEIRRGNRA